MTDSSDTQKVAALALMMSELGSRAVNNLREDVARLREENEKLERAVNDLVRMGGGCNACLFFWTDKCSSCLISTGPSGHNYWTPLY